MKTRLATLTAILATATLALTACAGSSGSTTTQSEATTQEASASSTRTITDHAGNEVVLPEKITRVAIDQIPIESTYLAAFTRFVSSTSIIAPKGHALAHWPQWTQTGTSPVRSRE